MSSITYQMVAKGRELADSLGTGLAILVVGHRLEGIIAALRKKGMDLVLVVDEPELAQAGAEVQAYAIAETVRRVQPRVILMGYSLIGMELAPVVAIKLGIPALTNCLNAEINDGALVVTRPLFDGTVHARIVLEGEGPSLVALQRGATPAQLPSAMASVQSVSIDVAAIPARSEVIGVIEEPAGDIDIAKAEVIVSVGRGIGDKDKIGMIEELAAALGGMLACSRPLVDLGWLPRNRQVGASGKSVSPKVYIACGISGAIQHLSGMSDSKMIVAINKDPNAPIFQIAHYGVVADLFEIVPLLIEEAKKFRGRSASS